AAYHAGAKLPSTKTLSKKIQDLTAAPPAKGRRSRKSATKSAPTTGEKPKSVDLWTEYERLSMTKAQAASLHVFHAVAKIDPHCAMPIAAQQLIQNAFTQLGQVIAVRAESKSAASKTVEFVLATSHTAEQIAAKGRIPTIVEEVIVELMLAAAAPSAEITVAA